MPTEWRSTFAWANHYGCDLCPALGRGPVVGWVEIEVQNRSLGGIEARHHFAVCLDHMTVGTPCYPRWVPEENESS